MAEQDKSVVSLLLYISDQLSSIKEEQCIVNERLERLENRITGRIQEARLSCPTTDKNILTTTKAGLQENPKVTQLATRLPRLGERNKRPNSFERQKPGNYFTTTYQYYFGPRDEYDGRSRWTF